MTPEEETAVTAPTTISPEMAQYLVLAQLEQMRAAIEAVNPALVPLMPPLMAALANQIRAGALIPANSSGQAGRPCIQINGALTAAFTGGPALAFNPAVNINRDS